MEAAQHHQGLFRNPLADPFLIGIASGAGLGAVVTMSMQWSYSFWGVDGNSAFSIYRRAADRLFRLFSRTHRANGTGDELDHGGCSCLFIR
ncbi:MAG: iron chelate uptake ABC transporter family permease subunit, partial [Anaerolineales bacterium]|nr:iron chelate uptake ABC transporter family permease subunit [Anaerolineales bacterium]